MFKYDERAVWQLARAIEVFSSSVLAALGVLLLNGPLVLAGPVIITYGIGLGQLA